MQIVISLDPSGNFFEGKGTTGFALARDGYVAIAGQIYSAEYSSQMEYWTAVIGTIRKYFLEKREEDTFTVVCEDYRLYASASAAQINSNLETPQLIGAIKWWCYMNNIPVVMQMASEVKQRWSNEVLFTKGLLKKNAYTKDKYTFGNLVLGRHSLDALRHLLHYTTFKNHTRVEKPKKIIKSVRKVQYKDY